MHSCAARAICFLVALASPCQFSDFERLGSLLDEFQFFNNIVAELPAAESCWAGGDFVDCFTHLDLSLVLVFWEEFCVWLREQGIGRVSVSKRPRRGQPHIGAGTQPGWVTFDIEHLSLVLQAFAGSNVLVFGSTVGVQRSGGPMGDPMSSASLAIWKWGRESVRPLAHTASEQLGRWQEHSRVHTALFLGVRVVFLFVSFKDDCRAWAAWRPSSALNRYDMERYLYSRFDATFNHGSMRIEPGFVSNRLTSRAAWGGHPASRCLMRRILVLLFPNSKTGVHGLRNPKSEQ